MSTSLLNSPPFHPISVAELEEARTSAEVELIVNRLEKLASEQERLQSKLTALRDERDSLILRGLAHGVSSSELAARARLTGARVRAIADAAASSSARERVARAVARLVEYTPAMCTTYGALAEVVGIGSAKGVASSLASNPDVSGRAGARVLLLRWAVPTRLECLRAEGLVAPVTTPEEELAWIVPFDRVCTDRARLARIIAG